MLKSKRQKINLSCIHSSNKGNQQPKTWFPLNISSFIDWLRKHVIVTLRERKNYFLDQQKRCLFFSLKFIYIFNKVFFRHLQKNYCAKQFWKSSVLVWHGQNSNMCQHVNKCTSRSTIKCTTSRSTRKCSTSRSTRKCTQVKRMLKQQFITFNS